MTELLPGVRAPSVAITIVSFNSARYLERCLAYVFAQEYEHFEVILIDNASTDESASILQRYADRATVVCNSTNRGFAGGQNQAMRLTRADWVLTLNPDVRLAPGFLAEAVAAGMSDPRVGAVCGKLLSMGPDFEIPRRPVFDSTGIYFTPNLRHFDRGSQQADTGQFDDSEFVFGATGAAALYRREMIADVSCGGEFFDENFFAYREDADVAWRAQWLGWQCLYTPQATAFHVRHVLPSNRRSLSPQINMHSVKNRFLTRVKNSTLGLYRHFGLAITGRDLFVLAACLFYEVRSLQAFWLLLVYLPRTCKKRRDLMRRKRATEEYVVSWFSYKPVSFPAISVPAAAPSLIPSSHPVQSH